MVVSNNFLFSTLPTSQVRWLKPPTSQVIPKFSAFLPIIKTQVPPLKLGKSSPDAFFDHATPTHGEITVENRLAFCYWHQAEHYMVIYSLVCERQTYAKLGKPLFSFVCSNWMRSWISFFFHLDSENVFFFPSAILKFVGEKAVCSSFPTTLSRILECLSNEESPRWLSFILGIILPSSIGIIKSSCKDPCETSSILESTSSFFLVSHLCPLTIFPLSVGAVCSEPRCTVPALSDREMDLKGSELYLITLWRTFVCLVSDLFGSTIVNHHFSPLAQYIRIIFLTTKKANLRAVRVCFFLIFGVTRQLYCCQMTQCLVTHFLGEGQWKIWVPVVRGHQNPSWSS